MPEAHPALAIEISVTAACRLFPGTPALVFWWAGHARDAGVRLTFGAAYQAAVAHWAPLAKQAQSQRFAVLHRKSWSTRRAVAAEAALEHLVATIEAELAAAPSDELSLASVAKLAV